METAKVDIRRLQILNDRINQCLDALNQVRLSVHGLSHTSPVAQGPMGGYPFAPLGLSPIGAVPYAPFQQGGIPGLSHTTGFAAAPGLVPAAVAQPFPWLTPWTGLSHTSPEVLEAYTRSALADPFLNMRIGQTFPFAQFAFPPVVSLY